MNAPRSRDQNLLLARQVRERFLVEIESLLPELGQAMLERLQGLAEQSGNAREMQIRRDAFLEYQKLHRTWLAGVVRAWRAAVVPPTATAQVRLAAMKFELLGDEVVENKILSSRIVLSVLDKVSWELNDLKLRVQQLEDQPELGDGDILKPEVVAQLMVEQWLAATLSRPVWHEVQDIVPAVMTERLVQAYRHANEFLVQREVMPDIDLKPLLRRAPSSGVSRPAPATTGLSGPSTLSSGPQAPNTGLSRPGDVHTGSGGPRDHAHSGGTLDETRMMTATTPLARARMRAQGVLGSLKRLLIDRVPEFEQTRVTGPSPMLAQAFSDFQAAPVVPAEPAAGGYDIAALQQTATALRQRTTDLKARASTGAEKATIEIVALMFQSILAEERIPANVRVWFARLQMPVLRVAVAESEFFSTLQHPARQLIDRMGSSVMGFDSGAINGSAMEAEIKRVVQVIEQYPETGRRVFQLVLDEFQAFLAKYLTHSDATQRVVSVAQQVEQKETMAIQYTIELRKVLDNVPVRDEIREFLFKVWAEVLAMAAVKHGPQHEDTRMLRKAATDLVWAASAKPNRNDRARVIQELPQLLQRLRQGMTLLGVVGDDQEAHIKTIGNTLADAFMSKTESIQQQQIDAMARQLASLEDFVSDEAMGELPLDAESLELMLGMDASSIEIVADGGSRPTEAMLAWVNELQLGSWFSLDHNGRVTQVQFVWRSDRRQLHLFATATGYSYLIQARRLASYLQAGLLVPTEEETLTVRATREALAKLDANPERLLS
ncbi:MAG: DUF1631 domain-containing protein [Burkholderiales bacterium]|nr:DUF1631 domain-containing protein [Burkholderiales bacterium]